MVCGPGAEQEVEFPLSIVPVPSVCVRLLGRWCLCCSQSHSAGAVCILGTRCHLGGGPIASGGISLAFASGEMDDVGMLFHAVQTWRPRPVFLIVGAVLMVSPLGVRPLRRHEFRKLRCELRLASFLCDLYRSL